MIKVNEDYGMRWKAMEDYQVENTKLKKQLEIAVEALIFYRDCCKDESNEDVIIHLPRLPAFRALLEIERVE